MIRADNNKTTDKYHKKLIGFSHILWGIGWQLFGNEDGEVSLVSNNEKLKSRKYESGKS